MSTQVAVREQSGLSIFSNGDTWELATKMAGALAKSTIVPKEYQGNPNNTIIAIELANRLNVSPLMVMQNLYVVYGRPSWSAQYVIAMINSSGKYDMELQFEEKADKDGKPYSCQCWTEKTGRKVTGPVIDMDMAKTEKWLEKNGSKWQTMPQIMLRYRAASFFGRMNCPELTMGIYTREEVYELGPDEYTEVPVEVEVQADVEAHANSKSFPSPQEVMGSVPEQKVSQEPQTDTIRDGDVTRQPEDDVPDFMR